MQPDALAILRKVPAVRFWRSDDSTDYKNALDANVSRWQELNDRLYWTSIAERRAHLAAKGERLVDDWQILFMGPFWRFGADDFDRCLGWTAVQSFLKVIAAEPERTAAALMGA